MEEFYNLLIMLARFVTRCPSKGIILEWYKNINLFVKSGTYGHLLAYEVLSSKINEICWDNHYCIFYYAFSL